MALPISELDHIIHFAKINGLMQHQFSYVIDEYFATKETAEAYESLSESNTDEISGN